MQLGKASAYAAFAVMYIAKHQSSGPVQGRGVAEACGIPPEYLLKILQQLTRGRVLVSETGRKGGFCLRKPASRTTLLEIVETIEGPLNGGLSAYDDICGSNGAKSYIQEVCHDIAEHARTLLRETTVRQLIDLPDSSR